MIIRTKNIPHSSGVYQIKSIYAGEEYIGSSVDLKRRWASEHLGALLKKVHGNRFLQRHYNKYGVEDLIFGIIEFCPKEKLIEREQFWIDELHPRFNLCLIAGSRLGTSHSEKTKQLLRDGQNKRMQNPELRQKYRDATLRNLSDPEFRKRQLFLMSEGRKRNNESYHNKVLSEETKQKISQTKKKNKAIPWNKGLRYPNKLRGKRHGVNNPMYGKHHTKDSIRRQLETKERNKKKQKEI